MQQRFKRVDEPSGMFMQGVAQICGSGQNSGGCLVRLSLVNV